MSDHANSVDTPSHKRGGNRPPMHRRLRKSLVGVSAACAIAFAAAITWIVSLGPAPLGEHLTYSTLVLDREGRLLRPYTTIEGRWRLPATRADVDPRMLAMLFAYEDKRFATHHGIDMVALGRAVSQLAVNGRIVSGASTLTMQVARLLEPRAERSYFAKFRQMVRAVEIERQLTKDQILALYLVARALWRQSRRHPCRLARLFRQGAAPAHAR